MIARSSWASRDGINLENPNQASYMQSYEKDGKSHEFEIRVVEAFAYMRVRFMNLYVAPYAWSDYTYIDYVIANSAVNYPNETSDNVLDVPRLDDNMSNLVDKCRLDLLQLLDINFPP
jgi:hypothetical protein